MSDKVAIINLTPWAQNFGRINTVGHVSLPAYGRTNIEREEVVSQCYAKNAQFVGTDGVGSHARIYIDDAEIRKEFEFDTETHKQKILTDEKLAKLFEYKRAADFEKNMRDLVLINAEKFALVDYVRKNKVNDYEKIRAIEKYVGVTVS